MYIALIGGLSFLARRELISSLRILIFAVAKSSSTLRSGDVDTVVSVGRGSRSGFRSRSIGLLSLIVSPSVTLSGLRSKVKAVDISIRDRLVVAALLPDRSTVVFASYGSILSLPLRIPLYVAGRRTSILVC